MYEINHFTYTVVYVVKKNRVKNLPVFKSKPTGIPICAGGGCLKGSIPDIIKDKCDAECGPLTIGTLFCYF